MSARARVRAVWLLIPMILGLQLTTAEALDTPPLIIGGKAFSDLAELCSMYGVEPAGSKHHVPKVFDLFLAGHELDMMEIRMQTLADVVDAFVPVESKMTFQGQRKRLTVPLLYNHLSARVVNKIRYVLLETLEGQGTWAREEFQRQAMLTEGIGRLGSDITTGDIIITSDCDEIPKPWFVYALKYCAGVKFPARMQARAKYYSFDRIFADNSTWSYPVAVTYDDAMNRTAADIRKMRNTNPTLYASSSWHCSYCFDSVASIHTKYSSFSHAELNVDANKNVSEIIRRVRMGLVIHDHENKKPKLVKDTAVDIPDYVIKRPSRFSYLLNRDVADAGFKDVQEFLPL